MKLRLRSMILFAPSFFAFGAFSHPDKIAPDAESSSVIKWAPRQTSHPDIDELPLDLSMKSQNQSVSANTPVTHKQVLQRLREFVVKRHKSKPQTRKSYGKLNLDALAHDIKKYPHATQKERASRLGIALRTVYNGLKRLRSVSVNSPSCSSQHLLYTNCYAHFYAALLCDLTRSEPPPVAPLQEKIQQPCSSNP